MALLPVVGNRTSTPLSTLRLLNQLGADQVQLQRHYDQLSSGRRVLTLSDDPAAAGRAIALSRDIAAAEQLTRNASAAEVYYNTADVSLASVDNALITARAAAVEAAGTLLSDDQRAAIEATLDEAIRATFAAANSEYRDHQLLGGVLGDGQPYRYDGEDIVYTGSAAVGRTTVGGGVLSPINVTGAEALGAGSPIFEGGPLGAAIDRDTRLIDLVGGRGITPGVILVSGGNEFIEVDLRRANTVGDVIDLLSEVEVEGRQLSASIFSGGVRLEYADSLPGTLAVRDETGGTLASELTLSNPTGLRPPPLVGGNLRPRITSGTPISKLNGGAGVDLTGGIQITQGDKDFVVDFTDVRTVGDAIIAINRSGADVRAELDEAEGRLRILGLRSGVDYSIGENGRDAASELKLRSADRTTTIESLGRGVGVRQNPDAIDLIIRRPDGVELEIDIEGLDTIGDFLDAVRDHPSNQDARRVLVGLNAIGNGIQITAPPGAEPLRITQTGLSDAGNRLGLIPSGESTVDGVVAGGVATVTGTDYAVRDAGGAMDTLLRMKRAVRSGDLPEISRLQAKLDDDLDRASRTRGRIGILSRTVDELKVTAEDRSVTLQAARSDELDADLATVISDISQRQLSLDASMRLIGQTANLTVLNYL